MAGSEWLEGSLMTPQTSSYSIKDAESNVRKFVRLSPGFKFLKEVDGRTPRKDFKTLNIICKAVFNLGLAYCPFQL